MWKQQLQRLNVEFQTACTHFMFEHDTQPGKMLNCKARTSIFREPISRDFLKHEALPEQKSATPIQVKGSNKHRKNATNGKHTFIQKGTRLNKNSPLKH